MRDLKAPRVNLLRAFQQCSGMRYLQIELGPDKKKHRQEILNWMRLYAAPLKAALQPCGGGFVFLDWSCVTLDDAHSTLLFFDMEAGTQILLDPSGALYDKFPTWVEAFNTFHLWHPVEDHPTVMVPMNKRVGTFAHATIAPPCRVKRTASLLFTHL